MKGNPWRKVFDVVDSRKMLQLKNRRVKHVKQSLLIVLT